jgi:hypothetical protein
MDLDSSEEPGQRPAQAESKIGSIRIATHLIDTAKFIELLKCNPFSKSTWLPNLAGSQGFPAVGSRPSASERESAFPYNFYANGPDNTGTPSNSFGPRHGGSHDTGRAGYTGDSRNGVSSHAGDGISRAWRCG